VRIKIANNKKEREKRGNKRMGKRFSPQK
jgi:hypothetical protein